MKKSLLLFSLLFLLYAPVARAQYVTIPDANFRAWLQTNYTTCMGTGPNAGMLDTTCAGVVNAHTLNVSSLSIADLTGSQYFDNLDSLNCSSNAIATLPSLPASLLVLQCNNNQLASLPALPASLQVLKCWQNQLTSLPVLPASLQELRCYNNLLTSLPTLSASLQILICNNNQLTSLPALPVLLEYINCNANQLTTLPLLPASLGTLYCPYNQLTSLPTLPASLQMLYCSNNLLASLPTLPASLEYLNCAENQLTSVPALPASLQTLTLTSNQLTSLPTLPSSLQSLSVNENQFTSLPVLPDSLQNLYFEFNQVTSLPALPASLQLLDCAYNPLTSLPALPASLQQLWLFQNPNLLCLPTLPPTLTHLYCTYTGITCLPNHPGTLFTLDPPTLQVCSPGNNPNGCPYLPHVDGTAFNDLNANDTFDVGEPPYIGLVIAAQPSGYMAGTDTNGLYQATVDPLVPYTVTVPVPPLYRIVTPTSHTGSLPSGNTVSTGNDFAIQDIPNVNDLRVTLAATTPPVPGFSQELVLTYKNIGTTALPATIELVYDDSLIYDSASVAPTTQSGDTLTWDVGTLAPWQTGNIHAHFTVPANVNLLGDTLYSTATITPLAGDTVPTDNLSQLAEEVVSSYDPNDKQVLPAGDIDFGAGEWLTYTVRFQNTGTAAAQTVVIRDTLDADLNIPTIQTTSASHNYVFELNGLNAAWYFNNIQLPDSGADEPGSHGFVQYRVKARHNLAVGTEVSNTASIYFDFNPPIVTNTVVNTVTQLSGFAEAGVRGTLRLFPNPSTGLVTVELPSGEGLPGAPRIEVLDVTGRVVRTAPPLQGGAGGGSVVLDLHHLPAGLYTIRAATANGVLTAKVVRN